MRPLDPNLIERLDLSGAIDAELDRRAYGFPSRTLEKALEGRRHDLLELITSDLTHGVHFNQAEVLYMAKVGGGLRPLSLLTIQQRIIYRAIVTEMLGSLPRIRRDPQDWERFERGPLEESLDGYVSFADTSHYYQYIDHGVLESELISQTGDAGVSDALLDFLGEATGKHFGIPQLYYGSDVLAEIYIDLAERQLLRRGLKVFRYNDDFKIVVSNVREAHASIEALALALRALGLTLNESKTMILSSDKYPEWISAPERRWEEINEEVQMDLREANEAARQRMVLLYGGAAIELVELLDEELDQPDVQAEAAAAHRALDIWTRELGSTDDRLRVRINRRLLLEALKAATRNKSPVALDYCKTILIYQRDLTHLIGTYLRTLVTSEQGESLGDHFEDWLNTQNLYLSSWQILWLLEPLTVMNELTQTLETWVQGLLRDDRPGPLRARAALVLGKNSAIKPAALAALYSDLPPASQPDVVAAMASLPDTESQILRSVQEDSVINRWVIEGAEREDSSSSDGSD